MTEERLTKYLVDHGIYSKKALTNLKEVINEAIQECADAASIKNVVGKNKLIKVVDRQSILNLKVK